MISYGHEQVSPSLTLPPPPPPHPGAGLPALPTLPPGLIPPVSMSSSEDLSHQVRIRYRGHLNPNLQGSAKRWSPGCVNDAGKARQKW